MRKNLFIFSLLKTILLSGSYLQKATNSNCFSLNSGKTEMQFWVLDLALGKAVRWLWAGASLAHAPMAGSWGIPGTGLPWSNPAATLAQSSAGLAQPSLDFLLSPALPSARPSPCQGCQWGTATESQRGGTGTEQIPLSSNQLPEIQWGGTQLCARVVGDVSISLSPSPGIFGYDKGSGLCQDLLLPSSTELAQQPSSCRAQDAAHIPGRGRAAVPPGERQHQDSRISTPPGAANAVPQLCQCPASGFSMQQRSGTSFV